MCGFVGVLRPRSAGPVSAEAMRALLPWIRHRGPDQEGVYVADGFGVAAARLEIRGGDEGDQPLVSSDGARVIAFNGELLARTTGVPAGEHCDTLSFLSPDVEPHAALAGSMGAVACFDRDVGRLVLARDALGIKPLHVARTEDGTLWFASELRALLGALPELRRPDRRGLAELLHWHRPREHLPFAGVTALAPGRAIWQAVTGDGYLGVVHDAPLPAFEPAAPPWDDEGEACWPERVGAAWRSAAETAADVNGPVSLLLSGGLDSAAVAAWAGRPDLICLTGRFGPRGGPFDESDAAATVARHHDLAHEIVDLRDEDLVADLPAVVHALEMPVAGPGSLALWRMARHARDGGRVVLTGTGGDELFGGYARTALALGKAGPWTRGYEPLRSRIEAAGEDPAARLRAAFDRSADLRPVLHADFAAMLPSVEGPLPRRGDTLLDALLTEEREGTLRSLLHVEDRVCMAHGLESRPVGCLGALPDVARALPAAWTVGADGEGKRALRLALAGHVPEAVRTDPQKRGFPTPFARAARGAGRERVEDWLGERRFRERGWWNVEACRRLLEEERPAHDRALFAVLSWEWWARWFLDGDAFTSGEGPPR